MMEPMPIAAALTDEQCAELCARLAQHRTNPDQPGVTLAQLLARLRAMQIT